MSRLAATFGGAVPILPHVTWPIIPHDGESLVGFTVRTCAHNGLWNPSVLVADAGIRLPKGVGHLPRVSRNLLDLAKLLDIDPDWVERRRHRSMDERGGRKGSFVDFHGATLRRVHLQYDSPRIAPTAMCQQKYHREIWHVVTLPACGFTGELLVEACEQPGCGKALAWAGTGGIGQCSDPHCTGTISNLVSRTLADAVRPDLALAAALIHPALGVSANALASLPECLQQENRGDLFELLWLLGCLNFAQGQKAIESPVAISPEEKCIVLARGAEMLLTWPSCVATALRRSVAEHDHDASVKRMVATLQAIVRKPMTFGRPAALLAAELDGISSNAFSAIVGQHLGLLTATEFARLAGIKNSQMAVLQRSTHLPRVLFSEGGRDIALFSPLDADDVRRRIKDRLPLQQFGSETGLGIDAVELLVGKNVLSLAIDPIIQALWPEPHLDRLIATDLLERITSKLKRDITTDDFSNLGAALHGCHRGDKPWPAIIDALLTGRLSLHHARPRKLNIRLCLISPHDVKTLHRLRAAGARCANRSKWLSEADARERLSTTSSRLRALAKTERLTFSGSYSGLTYLRSEIDAIAKVWVSTLELQAKLGLNLRRDLSATLSAAKLVADEYGLVLRSAARQTLGLSNV